MDIEPPAGANIKVDRDMYSTTYSWENGRKSIGQYGVAAFMIFWLCGWTVGGFMAAKTLFTNNDMPLFGRLFMLFWLGGWAFGEVAVIYALYNTFKPLKPAKLTLSSTYFEYDTGTKPYNFNYYRYGRSQEKPKFFQSFRNKNYRVELNQPVNLRLERVGERQRLTFDIGSERIEIGDTLTEPEREWLYEILREHIER
jgi:hypothetical protein